MSEKIMMRVVICDAGERIEAVGTEAQLAVAPQLTAALCSRVLRDCPSGSQWERDYIRRQDQGATSAMMAHELDGKI